MADKGKNKKDLRNPRRPPARDMTDAVSQADGTAADAPRGETQAQPTPANANTTRVNSQTPENRTGQINRSAPTESTEGGHVTHHLVGSGPSTMDSFGEVGHPSGKGTLPIDEQQIASAKPSARKSDSQEQREDDAA
jgi:hypothetical protein